MTEQELKRLCDDVQLACAAGYPEGCDEAAERVCTESGHFREGLTVRLARAASILLDQIAWHEDAADTHQRLSGLVLHAEHQAQRRAHEAAIIRIHALLEAM